MKENAKQMRDGIIAQIKENPSVITPMRSPLVADGFGGYVRSGAAVAQDKARVRLSHEKNAIVASDGVTPAGLGTSFAMYVLTDYKAPLTEGDTFTDSGSEWRVGPIDYLKTDGVVYATQAPLILVTKAPVTIPASFAGVAKDTGTGIDLSWTDVGVVNPYLIERKTGTAAFSVVAGVPAGTVAYADTGLAPETAYQYRMRAVTTEGLYSEYTPTITVTTEELPS